MSDSVRPHRRQPTRLRRPWDSPGKNTGVGCHFLLQWVKVKSLSHIRLLATPWTAAYQNTINAQLWWLHWNFARYYHWRRLVKNIWYPVILLLRTACVWIHSYHNLKRSVFKKYVMIYSDNTLFPLHICFLLFYSLWLMVCPFPYSFKKSLSSTWYVLHLALLSSSFILNWNHTNLSLL